MVESLQQDTRRWKSSIILQEGFVDYFFLDKATSSETSRQIQYEWITNDYRSFFEQPSVSLQLIHSLLLFANFLLLLAAPRTAYPVLILTAVVFFSAVAFRRSKNKTFAVRIDGDRGEIKFLVKVNGGEKFYPTLISKRNSYLAERYGRINWENESNAEIRKFEWLADLGVISKLEMQEATKQITTR